MSLDKTQSKLEVPSTTDSFLLRRKSFTWMLPHYLDIMRFKSLEMLITQDKQIICFPTVIIVINKFRLP